ncbi:hypothetical protein HRI_003046000 [Hibiscus trionum]|uniref:Uncharacterized protein n=1 Tax=Hibiscus trionum TaxID=183268 RepID=A0A9W7M855_HIBTR|nr:hypothetical protein HRI_003046000 [Hibiscus trionum]
MKGSEKKSSFSSPPIKSYTSSNDENLQTQKKQTVKTFMTPTVCAASKASFLRKKVLGERNESPESNSTITHFSKSPSLDSKRSPEIISKASLKNSPNIDPNVTSKDHYDPLKNYLSPRPKFLRYNPDRRKEILLRLEMEEKEGDDSTSESDEADNSSLASSSSQEDEESGDESESLSEEEDEEFDTEREEEIEEEAKEEATWSFKGVLKYFLLLVVLLLSTQYISSMNSPVSAPKFEGPAHCFQNHSLRIADGFEIGYEFLDGKQEQLGLLSFTQTMADEVIEVEMTENANMGHIVEPEETVEEESITMVVAYEEEMEETEGGNEVEKAGELKEDGEGENVIEDELVKIELQVIEETGEQMEETRDVIEEEMVVDIEQQEPQTDEEIEFVQVDHQTSLLSEGTESLEEIKDVPMVQVLIIRIRSAVSMLEKWGKSLALKFQELDPLKGFNQHMGTEMFLKFVFGFLAFAAIVASFVFGSNIRRKGIASKKEKPSLPLPVERDEPKKLDISNTMPLTTTSVMESRAPSVELLAEFEIGGINSSAINSRMKDEVSYSYFSEKDFTSKDQQGYSQFSALNSNSSERWTSTAKKKLSGSSAVNSGSSERSTSTAKKKGLGSNDEVITPLRRSARIRNRADVISP